MRYFGLLFIIFFINGCFPKQPQDIWRFYATASYNSYEFFILTKNPERAKTQLGRALEHAKSGTDYSMLKRIYLSKCALNKAMMIYDNCEEYKEITALDSKRDWELDNYLKFIEHRTDYNYKYLPVQYQPFAQALQLGKNYKKELYKIENPVSKMIASYIIRDQMGVPEIEVLLAYLSHHGYKFAAEKWLEYLVIRTEGTPEQLKFVNNLKILQNDKL